jgi:hypothetical protein
MTQLSPVLKAVVLGQKGPLVEGEIERAKEYARGLAVQLKELTDPDHWLGTAACFESCLLQLEQMVMLPIALP